MYIAICDDQPQQLELLQEALQAWQKHHKLPLRYKCFHSADALLEAARQEDFTLYLLDVVMPGTNGLEAAGIIRSFDDTADIIFLTTSPDFAYKSYSVHAADYLLKPISRQTLFDSLDRLLARHQSQEESLHLKCGAALVRIPFRNLTYVEVNGKHLYFNLSDGSVREVFGTLREYEPMLLERPEFMQVHRSYIVNMLQVEELSPAQLTTFDGRHVPVSRLLYPKLQKDYMELLFDRKED